MKLLFSFLILFPIFVYANQSLCQDPLYTLLEKKQSSLSASLLNMLDQHELKRFQETDKNWKSAMQQLCKPSDCECLTDQYQQHNLELSKKLTTEKAQSETKIIKFTGQDTECGFSKTFPKNMSVFAAGGHGMKSDYRIGEKGEDASLFRIIVNSPKQPVALILGTYNAAIWDISWTEGTKIEAAYVMGYHTQAVSGLPKTVPVSLIGIDKKYGCGSFSIDESSLHQINPLSNKLFNKNTDKVFFANGGVLKIGDPISDATLLFTSLDIPIESLHRPDAPLRGDAALNDAVSKGILRKLTQSDIDRWLLLIKKPTSNPPVANPSLEKRHYDYALNEGYIILKPFTFPEDLYGANSAIFFLENGVPYPLGNMGHSSLHDFNTQQCKGHSCIQK